MNNISSPIAYETRNKLQFFTGHLSKVIIKNLNIKQTIK